VRAAVAALPPRQHEVVCLLFYATSATMDNPGDHAFSVYRLAGTTWTPSVPAPFTNRMEPGVGVVGNHVVVIGGQEGPNLEPRSDAWVLDLPPAS